MGVHFIILSTFVYIANDLQYILKIELKAECSTPYEM